MFSKLAEIDFPGITFAKKFKVRNWLDLAGSHEIPTHGGETAQKSMSLKLPSLMSFTLHQLRNLKLHRRVICVRRIPIHVL